MPADDLRFGLRLRVADQRRAASSLRRFGSEVRRVGDHSDVAATLAGRQAAATRRLGDEARKAGRTLKGFGDGVQKAGRQTRGFGNEADRAGRQAWSFGQRLREAHGHVIRYAAVGGLAAATHQFGRAMLEAADANVDLRNRLRLVTDSEEELGRVRSNLLNITREVRGDLAADGTLSSELLVRAILASADDTERKWRQVNFGIGESFGLSLGYPRGCGGT